MENATDSETETSSQAGTNTYSSSADTTTGWQYDYLFISSYCRHNIWQMRLLVAQQLVMPLLTKTYKRLGNPAFFYNPMNYTETLNFIHSFKGNGRRPQLERMRWLLKQAGNPQTHFPTVHIVGTNGKGSTTSYLQNILTSQVIRSGPSPPLILLVSTNVFSINGTEIPR